ncbi:TPA: electron transport complex subunit RsxA [Aeromonas hydrophila]|uniref:electron transport complex subunit RsxA n=1 Tax=Aeromonas TaxID=642 RepID=UPI0009550A2D|nr:MULTISPECIES: electron transport complex subunit RsxA [Aeromonas]ELM3718541.1 electron transport complex subunit RsxA [Aeromonas hydrophila]MBF4797946.1 electron transport complex subunit RsxA [Aeromonas hydrophila]MBL0569331.1 electron transport complex subunit RsxA [Aeromonas hydrophila]MBL0670018.1 electron transport complex subunit RsxA [Aeromonas hydrophila]MBO0408217.1 electron transport complex subunit RsxA [Aeromonas hydrophila]
MTEYLLLLVGTVLINNFVLVKFLGLCPFMGVSGKLETAIGMGLATTFVMTLASASSYLMEHYILIPLNIAYLRTLAFILVIAVVVQFTEMVIRKSSPTLYRLLGIFLPLITTNCAVLGVALLSINEHHNFIQSIIYGFGAATGFSLVLILFAAMRERLVAADVPTPFRGVSIAMITAGLMSLAFMGFTGLIKI